MEADEPTYIDDGAVEKENDLYPSDEENDDGTGPSPRAPPNLHPDDPSNIFKLVRFLELVLAKRITVVQVQEADRLIRDYCSELLHVRGNCLATAVSGTHGSVPALWRRCCTSQSPLRNRRAGLHPRLRALA